ncbi:MAG: hypothetical protein H7319_06025 [Spirosoma sp.]|nr:hypothetical protein [Spirosoma sp.]
MSTRLLLLVYLFVATLTACKKDDPNTPAPTTGTQTDLLVAHNWLVTRVTTPNGQDVNRSRLNVVTQSLFSLNMQFRANGTVRALDPNASNTVVNGGTWVLTPDNKSIDVVVTGLSGNFPIVQLDRSQLILRQTAPVDGKNADINLVFAPSL